MILQKPVNRDRDGRKKKDRQEPDDLFLLLKAFLDQPEDREPLEDLRDEILQRLPPQNAGNDRENTDEQEEIDRPVQNARRRRKDADKIFLVPAGDIYD